MRVFPAEALRNGRVDQSKSNVGAPIWDSFTGKGGTQTWHPEFSYHGFRYLEVVGVPDDAQLSVTGLRTMARRLPVLVGQALRLAWRARPTTDRSA